ncbi:MAG TPA: MFS transporter [Nocardioidaceae bacterium]|nr:MFS transporter [Nocardioidaceae bacterium]
MHTYRGLFAVSEFRALFAGNASSVAGLTMQGLALSALVYAQTGSPFLAALAYLAGFLPQAAGAASLLSLADRVPPRGFLALWDLVRASTAVLLALGDLPVWGMLALVMTVGLGDAVAGAVRMAVVADLVPRDGFVLARSVLNISVGAMQIVGFAVGGTLLATIGAKSALLAAAGFAAGSAAVLRLGLRPHPPTAVGRASLSTTHRGNKQLLGSPPVRAVLIASWVPNGLIVGAEALYVPYAGDQAGTLFVAAAGGMLVGDVAIGRWVPPTRRTHLAVPLLMLLAAPYLIFIAQPGLWSAALIVTTASLGFSATLVLQDRLISLVPDELRAQAFGLAGSGMMTMQALGAAAAGSIAELFSPGIAMAAVATASLLATTVLARQLRNTAAPVAEDIQQP